MGEPIKDWGIVFAQKRRFVTEQLQLALYHKNTHMNLLLTINYTILSRPNVFNLVLEIRDLPRFVSTLWSNYEKLSSMAYAPGLGNTTRIDKPPWDTRLLLKVVYGVKASVLLLDSKDPCVDEDFAIYGFVSRKSEKKVFFPKFYTSSNKIVVISGDGLSAALKTLSTFLEEGAGLGS
jgi:hypothetical protein